MMLLLLLPPAVAAAASVVAAAAGQLRVLLPQIRSLLLFSGSLTVASFLLE